MLHHARQLRRNGGIGDVQQRRVVLEDGAQRFDAGVALECAAAAHHLVERGAEAEDVAAMIRILASHLLGRHVARSAQNQCARAHSCLGSR